MSSLPPAEFLRECFYYNPETGELYWRERPLHHFSSPRQHKSFNTRFAGKRAFTASNIGYPYGRLTYNGVQRAYLAHQLIWKMVYDQDPPGDIDHKDMDRSNNRLSNLRVATRSENLHNSTARANRSGYKGVSQNGSGYMAKITRAGRQIYLGTFVTALEASRAYAAAAKEIYGRFSRS